MSIHLNPPESFVMDWGKKVTSKVIEWCFLVLEEKPIGIK